MDKDKLTKKGFLEDIGNIISKLPLDKIPEVIDSIKKIIDVVIGEPPKNLPQPQPVPAPAPSPAPTPQPPTIPEMILSTDGEWQIEGVITNAQLPLLGKMSLTAEATLNVTHLVGNEDLEATLEITKFSLNGINQTIKPGRGKGQGKGKLRGDKIIAGPISLKLNGPLGEMTVNAAIEGIVQDSDADSIADRSLGNLYFEAIGLKLAGTFVGKRVGERKISPPQPIPKPEDPKKEQDAISFEEFGNTKEQNSSWFNLPINYKITSASRSVVMFDRPNKKNSDKADPGMAYRTVVSNGKGGAHSAGVSSHGTRRQLNIPFSESPIYFCVFEMVEHGKKIGRSRSQIIRVN